MSRAVGAKDTDDRTNGTTARASRAHSGGEGSQSWLRRVLVLGLLAGLITPVLMMVFASSASARDGKDDDPDNYSLYQLASNANSYFSQENSPEGKSDPADRMTDDWREVTHNAATGGDMLGYADPKFSIGHIVGWLFAEISGSSQTVGYGTLTATDGGEDTDIYAGMLDYAHFGATNAGLGLDTMSSGIGGQIVGMIGGSLIWVLYALALATSMLFYLITQLLKIINPFLWFGQAVSAINTTFGEGMTRGNDAPAPLKGLANFVDTWYGMINSIAWEALVPLFIALTVTGLILFKKMDRGSAIKKLIVRIVYIGVGLPLIGSLYTGVLDKFDDSLLGQHSGPTRVVLSTYVDFESWAMNDRLGIPDAAEIAWDNGQRGRDDVGAHQRAGDQQAVARKHLRWHQRREEVNGRPVRVARGHGGRQPPGGRRRQRGFHDVPGSSATTSPATRSQPATSSPASRVRSPNSTWTPMTRRHGSSATTAATAMSTPSARTRMPNRPSTRCSPSATRV